MFQRSADADLAAGDLFGDAHRIRPARAASPPSGLHEYFWNAAASEYKVREAEEELIQVKADIDTAKRTIKERTHITVQLGAYRWHHPLRSF
jgi:hypothetical protein